jgi:Rod binding domain-containing protein
MKIPVQQFNPISPKGSKTRSIKDAGASLEAKRMRLRKATREFESFFILHMLKAMRKTIPRTDLLGNSLGQDIYTSLFDEELSKKIVGNSSRSLADVLYRSLEKHLEASESKESDTGAVEIDTGIENKRRECSPPSDRPAKTLTVPAEHAGNSPITPPGLYKSKPKTSADPVLEKYGSIIEKASRSYDVDPRLIYSVIMAESGGKADAISSKGARGLMQLMDSTASEMGVADSLNPHQNIIGGTKYLRQLLDRYDGNTKLALAAYNAGPGVVSKYNGVPPYSETRDYVEKVLGSLYSLKKR